MITKFDDWEDAAIAWLDGKQLEPPEPLTTRDTLKLLQLCKRAYAIEHSVTQGVERTLRVRYNVLLEDALGIKQSSTRND